MYRSLHAGRKISQQNLCWNKINIPWRRRVCVSGRKQRYTSTAMSGMGIGSYDYSQMVDDKDGRPLFMTMVLSMVAGAMLWDRAHANTPPSICQNEASHMPIDKSKEDNISTMNKEEDEEEETTTLLNWSGTHSVDIPTSQFHEPESISELEHIVQTCYTNRTPLRPLGSALSPNGIGFNPAGMVSLVHLDKVVHVDGEASTVTVQAGARVSQLIDELRRHKLTLPNLASIAEQQIGGFVQVGAHGTGATITPVDDFVTSITLVTPSKHGTVTLTPQTHGRMFHMAKVGLGCLGVVSEVTLQCVPAHTLLEHTYVLTRAEAKQQIQTLLKKHRHLRYMWIPFEDAVVVVTNDPVSDTDTVPPPSSSSTQKLSKEEEWAQKRGQFQPLIDLLLQLDTQNQHTEESLLEMGFGELRDMLLAIDPLNMDHVKLCNKAEAQFWKNSEGYRVLPSDQLLQFDCGGQQWVWEVCFPTGTLEHDNGNDMTFMDDLLHGIECNDNENDIAIAAHSPIEQRWTRSSSSCMSPAHDSTNDKTTTPMHSWVGIIMYLPSDVESQRIAITDRFRGPYCNLLRTVGERVNATSHWAKLEMPQSQEELTRLRASLKSRFPVSEFNQLRQMLDEHNLMSNDLMNAIFNEEEKEP